MSDKISSAGKTDTDSGKAAPVSASSSAAAPHKTTLADLFNHISITQMTLVLLVAIFVWQWLDGHRAISDMRQELAQKIAEMDGASKAGAILSTQNQDEVRAMSVKVAKLESYYDETQNQRAALETLYNTLSVSRDETALADVEQLLLIAGQQLQLLGNVRAALIAMESADERLQRMNRPAFNGLRLSIEQDIDKLRALPKVDIPGMDMKINRLLLEMDDLPLPEQQRAVGRETAHAVVASANDPAWQRMLQSVWLEIKDMVRIENTGLKQIPLLPPKEEFFLRENIKMRLMLARLAMLSHDEVSFKQELKTAHLWTKRFFDVKSSQGKQMLDDIDKLAAASVSIELPDISPSLQAVRSYRLSHDTAAEIGTAYPHKAAR